MPRKIFEPGYYPRRVVVTGALGIPSKNAFLAEVRDKLAEERVECEIFDVGGLMYRNSPKIPPGGILNASPDLVAEIRKSAYREILRKVEKLPNETVAILNTRSVFRWSNVLLPDAGLSVEDAREFGADLFINLQDSCEIMHEGINNSPSFRPYGKGCSLAEVLAWREEEYHTTKLICDAVAGSNRLFLSSMVSRDRKESRAGLVANLIANPNRLKAYLSFPITHVMDNHAVMEEIAQFKQDLSAKVSCFDPYDIEDWPLLLQAKKAKEQGADSVQTTVNGKPWSIPVQEILAVEQSLKGQIYIRDMCLVDQSDIVVQYVPEHSSGLPAISQGAEGEAARARNSGKPLHVIWKPEGKIPSPFCDWNAQISRNPDEVLALLRKQGLL